MLATFEDEVMGTMSFNSLTHAVVVAVAMMGCAFVIETFFYGDSVTVKIMQEFQYYSSWKHFLLQLNTE
jgi:hypothetical protein